MSGVTVSAAGRSTTTNASGLYTLTDVPAGTQIVSASLSGYFNDGRGSASVQVVEGNTVNASLVLVPISNGEVLLWHLKPSSTVYSSPIQKQLGGTIYYGSLICYGYKYGVNNPAEAIYAIGRRYSRFRAMLGVADDASDLNAEVVFKVIGDGVTIHQSQPMKVGMTDYVDLNVYSVLTLQLQVERVAGTGSDDPEVVWGDARLTPK